VLCDCKGKFLVGGREQSAGKLGNIEPDNARSRGLTLAGRIYTCERMVSTRKEGARVRSIDW